VEHTVLAARVLRQANGRLVILNITEY
jgi:hypothetical protein